MNIYLKNYISLRFENLIVCGKRTRNESNDIILRDIAHNIYALHRRINSTQTKFKMFNILVLHGPNLNLLGEREPKYYSHTTLANINQQLVEMAQATGHTLTTFQSNAEHELLEHIHTAPHNQVNFIIINPAAFTHTSIALRDALLAVAIPFIEVHLSNVHAREPFRHHSYFSDIAVGVISGLGAQGYTLALQAALSTLSNSR